MIWGFEIPNLISVVQLWLGRFSTDNSLTSLPGLSCLGEMLLPIILYLYWLALLLATTYLMACVLQRWLISQQEILIYDSEKLSAGKCFKFE